MIGFWIAAGLLIAGALLFLLPPLLGTRQIRGLASHDQANVSIYRDQLQELDTDLAAGTISPEQHGQARLEIERRVLEETGGEAGAQAGASLRGTALGVGFAVPVLAFGIYLLVGNPAGLDPEQAAARAAEDQSHSITPEQIAAMVTTLSERLKNNPGDAEGWAMLARSYNVLQRFGEAAEAFQKAVALVPNNAQLLADYADTLGVVQGRKLQGEPERLIERALQADPSNVKALALAGTVAYQKQDYATAAQRWQEILQVVPPESEFAQSIGRSIADARQRMGAGAPAAPVARAAEAKPATGAVGELRGTVKLAPDVAARAAPEDAVFIFARAESGPRAPLAIVRRQVKDLPFEFSLDDSMAMAPNLKLSGFSTVMVGARVSKSGNAIAQPGDIEGVVGPVAVGARGLVVTIDTVLR